MRIVLTTVNEHTLLHPSRDATLILKATLGLEYFQEYSELFLQGNASTKHDKTDPDYNNTHMAALLF